MLFLDLLEQRPKDAPPVSDALKLCTHRPEVYGEPFMLAMQEIMQGPSSWSIGERELFAAYTSSINRCRY